MIKRQSRKLEKEHRILRDCRLILWETRLQSGETSSQFQLKPIMMANACRHPKVRIVSRHEDTEFVECLECGEVFDSEEFRDMEIEDTAETQDVSDDE